MVEVGWRFCLYLRNVPGRYRFHESQNTRKFSSVHSLWTNLFCSWFMSEAHYTHRTQYVPKQAKGESSLRSWGRKLWLSLSKVKAKRSSTSPTLKQKDSVDSRQRAKENIQAYSSWRSETSLSHHIIRHLWSVTGPRRRKSSMFTDRNIAFLCFLTAFRHLAQEALNQCLVEKTKLCCHPFFFI